MTQAFEVSNDDYEEAVVTSGSDLVTVTQQLDGIFSKSTGCYRFIFLLL